MRLATTCALGALLAALPASRALGQSPASVRPSEQLGWLSGCWELRRANGVRVEEMWTAPRGGILQGTGRTTRARGDSAATLIEHEATVIEERGDTLIYHARPSGQAPADFRADTLADGVVSFSNPAHDFPQRVRYARAGRDSLVATIEGPRGGVRRRIDFRYARVSCPGAPTP